MTPPDNTTKNKKDNGVLLVLPPKHRLRDEFTCPITRSLYTDPVICADGHTYDRYAMEAWFQYLQERNLPANSPKTGEKLEHSHLIPNHNLKRLLGDMISEGRIDSLVTKQEDDTTSEDVTALVKEKVLILKCLGPLDSAWNQRSFRVTQNGVVGGRKRVQTLEDGAQFVHFADSTISRKHFDIRFRDGKYWLQDLGSAGGTFYRIAVGQAVPLVDGTMIMLGKHQLIVQNGESSNANNHQMSCDNRDNDVIQSSAQSCCVDQQLALPYPIQSKQTSTKSRSSIDTAIEFQPLVSRDNQQHNDSNTNEEQQEQQLTSDVASLPDKHETEGSDNGGDYYSNFCNANDDVDSAADEQSFKYCSLVAADEQPTTSFSSKQQHLTNSNTSINSLPPMVAGDGIDNAEEDDKPVVVLRCFGPEGTPIQNHTYPIHRRGATLGRKQTNNISFSHDVEGTLVGIDSSVSSEHARIEFNEKSLRMELFDGQAGKNVGSTNGTWIRLSGMHKVSVAYPIENDMEILVGTLRFHVSIEHQVVEKELSSIS